MTTAFTLLATCFGIVLTALGTMLMLYLKDIKNDFKFMRIDVGEMSDSMGEMNIKLEKVITDQTWHKEEMKEVKARISLLEKRSGG